MSPAAVIYVAAVCGLSYGELVSLQIFMSAAIHAAASLSVGEAAELLGRDRTRVYALLRSGDLVAAPGTDGDDQSLRLDRSSVERWAVAGGSRGGPLTPRNAWAIIGLASGDEALAQHCLGLLERREEVSRARTRLAAQGLFQLASRLRRRASLTVLHLPLALVSRLEGDEQVVLTGSSVARPYGWHALRRGEPWALDVYLRASALQILVDQAAAVADRPDEADGLLFREPAIRCHRLVVSSAPALRTSIR